MSSVHYFPIGIQARKKSPANKVSDAIHGLNTVLLLPFGKHTVELNLKISNKFKF